MSDACIVCECEAVDTEEWYFNKKIHEFVCPWCVKDMKIVKDGMFDINMKFERPVTKEDEGKA